MITHHAIVLLTVHLINISLIIQQHKTFNVKLSPLKKTKNFSSEIQRATDKNLLAVLRLISV